MSAADKNTTRVLLIEDNPGDARLIREMVRDMPEAGIVLEHANKLAAGLERLAAGGIDIVLLDLTLPDSKGFPTLRTLQNRSGRVPVIVLTGLEDEDLAVNAVRQGAQDYLVKGQIDSMLLVRSLRHARERHALQQSLDALSQRDELTGVVNRHGFRAYAQDRLLIAHQVGFALHLLLFNIDGLKMINDRHGNQAGDQAIREFTAALAGEFQRADIVARLGGSDFVVLAADVPGRRLDDVEDRVTAAINAQLAKNGRAYSMTFSMGTLLIGPADAATADIADLVARASGTMKSAALAR